MTKQGDMTILHKKANSGINKTNFWWVNVRMNEKTINK